MLQLPERAQRSAIKQPRKVTSEEASANCPVLRLAHRYDETNDAYNAADEANDDYLTRALYDEMEDIADRASHLTPTSDGGACFMLMLAYGCLNTIIHGSTAEIRQRAERQQQRIFFRLDEYMGGEVPTNVRDYLMPVDVDPAFEKRPRPDCRRRSSHAK